MITLPEESKVINCELGMPVIRYGGRFRDIHGKMQDFVPVWHQCELFEQRITVGELLEELQALAENPKLAFVGLDCFCGALTCQNNTGIPESILPRFREIVGQ